MEPVSSFSVGRFAILSYRGGGVGLGVDFSLVEFMIAAPVGLIHSRKPIHGRGASPATSQRIMVSFWDKEKASPATVRSHV